MAAGCGGDDGGGSASTPPDRTERFEQTPLREPGESGTLNESAWRGRGVRVQMLIDGAPRAQLRFFNQLSEQLQFYNSDPNRRPYQVKGVGQDSAYGGAGAWWTRTKSQMVAYAKNRIVRVRVVGRGFGDAEKRRAAGRLARLAFERLSAPAS